MAIYSFILLLLSLVYTSCEARSPVAATSRASSFVKASCSTTKYPALCIQSLAASAPSIQQSPRQLAQTALSVSLDRARATQAFVSKMKKFKGLKKREYEAIKDCMEEMSEGVDRLSKSVQELKHMGQAKGQDFLWYGHVAATDASRTSTQRRLCQVPRPAGADTPPATAAEVSRWPPMSMPYGESPHSLVTHHQELYYPVQGKLGGGYKTTKPTKGREQRATQENRKQETTRKKNTNNDHNNNSNTNSKQEEKNRRKN
ncbi:21 kDa protein-like [Hibiscus syriacus]|uniref:21 kDa protein-like n=1 Tax=Hibiscus syriacus TaxID=106335 RepID=A0A6A2Y8G6_HIBSY|nr:21 kDa protein-like [Hibiscus syriacus]